MEWVFDASVTLTWCFEDEKAGPTEALFDRLAVMPAVVPQVWPLEVGNTLTQAVRRGRITGKQRADFIRTIASQLIDIDGETATRAFDTILSLADQHRLTTYDAAYLELAVRRGIPLATLDADLRAAATAAGVPLLP